MRVDKIGDCTLYLGDCIDIMPAIGPVDAAINDPPYGTTACKWDSIIPIDKMWKNLKRVVTDRGAVVMTSSQPFTTVLINSNMNDFKYCWVWHKKTSANVALAKHQPLKVHEDIVVFNGKYNPQMVQGKMRMKGGKAIGGEANGSLPAKYYKSDEYFPSSVLEFGPDRGYHPTQKPIDLMKYLISTYTNEGETVLDFTMGSGTTGVACAKLGRKFVGIELEEKYFDIACERIRKAYDQPDLFVKPPEKLKQDGMSFDA